jgi:hypothetical protein
MATPSIESARGWRGRVMVDRDSNKIGEVVEIYLDNETDRPEWAVVRTGLFGLRSTFVPLAEAREVGDELQVPHQRLQVKQAPNIEPDGQLSAAAEAELYRHYGLDYDSVTLDNGAPADQTLAEPADQTDEPERTDQAGATAVPERERARKAASESASAYDRIRPVDTAPDEAFSPQTSLLPTGPAASQPVTNSGSVDSGLEEVRQLRAEGLSLPGRSATARLPLDPGPADPLRREAAGVTSPTACLQCSADRTAGALEHGILDGSFQSGQAPQW